MTTRSIIPKYYLGSPQTQLRFWIAIATLFTLVIGFSRIIYPYDVGNYEAGVWAPASLVAHGNNPYTATVTYQEPYTMSPYGIIYYLIVGIGLKFFGTQFWFARTLSLLCVIISCICISKLIYRLTKNRNMALLGSFLFLAQAPVVLWVGVQRPDLLALTLSLLGISSALTMNIDSNKFGLIIIQAVLVGSAVLTRQTSILPICIISFWFLINKAYYKLVLFLGSLLIFLSAFILVLNLTSSGGYLWQNFILSSLVSKSFAMGLDNFKDFISPPVIICSLLLWLFFYRNRVDARTNESTNILTETPMYNKVFLTYFFLALLLAMVTASRYGSSLNYYLEVVTVISIAIPLYGDKINREIKTKKIYSLILFLIGLSMTFQYFRTCRGEYFRWKSKKYYDEIVSVIKEKTNKDEPSFSTYPELVALAGRTYFFNDFVQYDGRAPLQRDVYDSVMSSGKLAAIVKSTETVPQGYYRYKLSSPLPDNYYKVFLFCRKPKQDNELDSLSQKK